MPTCPLGHLNPPRQRWQEPPHKWLQCPQCGLLWVTPQADDLTTADMLASGFDGKLRGIGCHTSDAFRAYRPVLRRLAPYNLNGRLLDVGAFSGKFLLAARANGWSAVEGVELSPAAVDFARETFDLTMHNGSVMTLDLPLNYYDAITLMDVIEHVNDPLATIKRLYALLRPGGILYMNTPHLRSIPFWLYGQAWSNIFPDHRTLFCVENMTLALGQAGFEMKIAQAVGILPLQRRKTKPAKGENTTPNHAEPSRKSLVTHLKPYRRQLRPLWLALKQVQRQPFRLLSALGIHIGATLIVYAQKPDTD